MPPPGVAIIENRAEITAEVKEAARPDPERPGYLHVRVRVIRSDPVESWPNLFERDADRCIDLYVPDSMAALFPVGEQVKFIAKKTGLSTAFVQI